MLAPLRKRISKTSPFPVSAAMCNGVWKDTKINQNITISFLVNVSLPSVIKIYHIMHYSSGNAEILFLPQSTFSDFLSFSLSSYFGWIWWILWHLFILPSNNLYPLRSLTVNKLWKYETDKTERERKRERMREITECKIIKDHRKRG